MSDVGKFAKVNGVPHPRDLRRIDPIPEKPTPKASNRIKVTKIYGYQYCMNWGKGMRSRQHWQWYETAKQRDQAMLAHNKKYSHFDWITSATPVERGEVTVRPNV